MLTTEFLKENTESTHLDVVADTKSGGGFSGESVLTFKPTKSPSEEPAWVEITIPATEAGSYNVQLRAKYYNTYGTYQMVIDGVPVGNPIDFSVGPTGSFSTVDFGVVTLEAKEHKVRFELTGPGSAQGKYDLAAVSYTHLDVYKRQAVRSLQRFQLAIIKRKAPRER